MEITSKRRVKAILSDIRFWILIFFLIRMVGITNPPLETGHGWRQSLTCMIARNFVETDNNILYPRIDYSGSSADIIGSEFPFFNYLIYLVSLIFGYSHWYGRLINLVVSSAGVYYFYLLVKKICSQTVAFNAAIILLTSIWFAFSRKIMPDTFSVSLVIIGLYYCYNYLEKGKTLFAVLFFIFVTLGVLCKIPALSLMAAVAVILFIKEIPAKRKLIVIIISVISFIIVCIWYFYWVPHLVDLYHNQLYFSKGIAEGLNEIKPYIFDFLEKFYFSSLYSYIAFVCCLAGVYFVIRSREKYLKTGLIMISLAFFVFIIKTGTVFPTHNYYIIPFTPLMAFFAGYAISKLPVKYFYIPLILISIEAIANQQHDFFIKGSNKYILTVEEIADKTTSSKDIIVINGGQGPRDIYFTHRKGWTIGNDKVNESDLKNYKEAGAKYLILDKNSYPGSINYLETVYSGKDYSVYKL